MEHMWQGYVWNIWQSQGESDLVYRPWKRGLNSCCAVNFVCSPLRSHSWRPSKPERKLLGRTENRQVPDEKSLKLPLPGPLPVQCPWVSVTATGVWGWGTAQLQHPIQVESYGMKTQKTLKATNQAVVAMMTQKHHGKNQDLFILGRGARILWMY